MDGASSCTTAPPCTRPGHDGRRRRRLPVKLPVMPPVSPMLAKAATALPPAEGLIYEPKWDGFRCVVFRDGGEVELGSRNERPLTRYFPDVCAAVVAQLPER